jgi:hypothetical protein
MPGDKKRQAGLLEFYTAYAWRALADDIWNNYIVFTPPNRNAYILRS